MNSSDSQFKLPTWAFILTDVVALGIAVLIGATSKQPFSSEAILGMVACVSLGAIFGLVPIIMRYERVKNETLDERQRALESLSRTIHASAEQIGIATNGLHEIAELAQRNLRQAEHLPQKLQEKIAEFQAGLTTAADTEKEEMERELLALRTSESERLDTVSQRIAKSAAEWTKLEASTQQQLTAANEALGKLSLGTASAIGKAQAAAEQALTQARTEAAKSIGEASGNGTRAIETAKAAALAEIDAKFAAAVVAAIERVRRELAAAGDGGRKTEDREQRTEDGGRRTEDEKATAAPTAAPVTPVAAVAPAPVESAPAAETATVEAAPAEPVAVATPVKRPRKPKREEAPAATTEPAPAPAKADAAIAAVVEPPPVPADQIPEVAPIAPHTTEPFNGHLVKEKPDAAQTPVEAAVAPAPEAALVAAPVTTAAATETPVTEAPGGETPAAAPAPAPRKRAKKAEAAPAPAAPAAPEEPALALDLDGLNEPVEARPAERARSSDGATRLVVTSYIGIGNRLFIRGVGPGLSWEKGVPLQFISIGKWRWESNDATSAVQFKLYKNDEVECTALGEQNLDPGHQQEITAAF